MRKGLVILIAAIALAGCSEAQKGNENGSAVPADAAADNSELVANGPGALGIATDDLPDFVELPKSARVTTNMRMNDGDKAGGTLTLETAETPAALIAFYRASMARHGLKIGLENTADKMVQLMGESEDKARTLMVTVLTDDAGAATLNLVHSRVIS